jgi:hypothetical protein
MAAYEWPVALAPCHDVPETVVGLKPGLKYSNIFIGTLYGPPLQLLNTKCQSLKIIKSNFITKSLIFNAL